MKELKLETTRFFSPQDRARARSALANLHRWAPTLRLTGTVDVDSPTRSSGTFRLVDMKTGKTTWEQRFEVAGNAFDLSEAIAKGVMEQLCDGDYNVTLSLRTDLNAATHTASGTLSSVLIATGTRLANGDPPTRFAGTGPMSYQGVAFTSTIGCAYSEPVNVAGAWSVTLTVTPAGRLAVTWGLEGAGPSTTASILCPESPAIPGQPGPSLINPTPTTFEVPLAGGQQAISGGVLSGGDGFTHAGTLTIARR